MSDEIRKRITAKLGPQKRCKAGPFKIGELGFDIADQEVAQTLKALAQDGLITWQPGSETLKVEKPEAVGAMELVRSFCRRNYGNVSPLIDRTMAQALLRRYGADYSLDCPELREDLEVLASEGYLRVLDNDRAFFKILGG